MSMNCPKCDAKGKCLDSRHRVRDHTTSRTYKCTRCSLRWSTTEVIVSQGTKREREARRGHRGTLTLSQMRDRAAVASYLKTLTKELT
jgi:transcriptional regulator NrdR family protein